MFFFFVLRTSLMAGGLPFRGQLARPVSVSHNPPWSYTRGISGQASRPFLHACGCKTKETNNYLLILLPYKRQTKILALGAKYTLKSFALLSKRLS